jgi:hypothetical protein
VVAGLARPPRGRGGPFFCSRCSWRFVSSLNTLLSDETINVTKRGGSARPTGKGRARRDLAVLSPLMPDDGFTNSGPGDWLAAPAVKKNLAAHILILPCSALRMMAGLDAADSAEKIEQRGGRYHQLGRLRLGPARPGLMQVTVTV